MSTTFAERLTALDASFLDIESEGSYVCWPPGWLRGQGPISCTLREGDPDVAYPVPIAEKFDPAFVSGKMAVEEDEHRLHVDLTK